MRLAEIIAAIALLVLAHHPLQLNASKCPNSCSGRGECIDSGVCLCTEGWYGADCTGDIAAWKKMHKLEHNFYEHHAFKSRYVIAAHHLKHCRHIVEIGGYRTPITHFLTSQHASVTVLDPYVKPVANHSLNGAECKVRHLPMMFEDFEKHLTGEEDCFVYMGLDYYDEKNMALCKNLKHRVHTFNTVVVDYAGKYPTGAQCFQALELPTAYDRVTSVVLELENNDWGDLSNSWLPTGLTTRVLYVLQKRGTSATPSQPPPPPHHHHHQPPLSSPATTPPTASNPALAAAAAATEALGRATGGLSKGAQRRDFSNPQQYSGHNAPEEIATNTDTSVEQVIGKRAGGEVRGDGEEEGLHGWTLRGITEPEVSGSSQIDDDVSNVAEAQDNFRAAVDHAKLRKLKTSEVYWSRHEAAPAGGEIHVAQLFEFAMAHYNAHAYRRAAELLVRVVEKEPKDPRGYNNLGLCLESAGAFSEAKEVLKQGLTAAPSHHGLNYNYAKLLMDDGNFEEAIQKLLVAVQTDHTNPDIHFYLGAALRQLGNNDVAERAFQQVLEIDPRYAFRYINTETNKDYEHFVVDEEALLNSLSGGVDTCASPSHGNSHMCALRDIVLDLRSLEQTLGFVADRQIDGRKTQLATGYMKHSFAYGSTFYQSWRQVFNNTIVMDAVAHAKANNLYYGVLGSSIGWHVFYGALTWDMQSKGWEILCSQVDISNGLADRHGLRQGGFISFECADALAADLNGVHIVVLAFSRDVNLGKVLNEKLARELKPGALVLSWSRILDAQPEFKRAAVYKVAVSWSENWGLYVYQRRED